MHLNLRSFAVRRPSDLARVTASIAVSLVFASCTKHEPMSSSASAAPSSVPASSGAVATASSQPSAPSSSVASGPVIDGPPLVNQVAKIELTPFEQPTGPSTQIETFRFFPDLVVDLQGTGYVGQGVDIYSIKEDGSFANEGMIADILGTQGIGYFPPSALLDLRGRMSKGSTWLHTYTFHVDGWDRFSADQAAWSHPTNEGLRGQIVGATWVTAWSEGRNLGLLDGTLAVMDGQASGPLPVLAAADAACKTKSKTRIVPQDLAATSLGDVFVSGTECGDEAALAVESFPPHATSGTFTKLPALPGLGGSKHVFVRARSHDNVAIVVASDKAQYVLRQVGEDWHATTLPGPSGAPVRAVSLASDGTVWMLLRDTPGDPGDVIQGPHAAKTVAVLGLDAKGSFSDATPSAPKDRGMVLTSLFGLDAKRVVVAGGTMTSEGSRFVSKDPNNTNLISGDWDLVVGDWRTVWVTGKQSPFPSEAAKPAEPAPAPSPVDGPSTLEPWTQACTAPFVVMFQISDLAPADYDYPATRDALRDWPLRKAVVAVEYQEDKHRRLGIRVKSKADADALIAQVKKGVQKMSPQFVCYAPPTIVRVIPLN